MTKEQIADSHLDDAKQAIKDGDCVAFHNHTALSDMAYEGNRSHYELILSAYNCKNYLDQWES